MRRIPSITTMQKLVESLKISYKVLEDNALLLHESCKNLAN